MQNKGFAIIESTGTESATFFVKGRVNTANASTLEYRLEKALEEGRTNIILNMSQADYLSSTGIKAILKIYRLAREAGGKFNIEFPSENVKSVLCLMALDELFLK